jgi:hypothetical protein
MRSIYVNTLKFMCRNSLFVVQLFYGASFDYHGFDYQWTAHGNPLGYPQEL